MGQIWDYLKLMWHQGEQQAENLKEKQEKYLKKIRRKKK